MSSEDQDAKIVSIVKERSEAKKQHAILQDELRSGGKALKELGTHLEYVGTVIAPNDPQLLTMIDKYSDLLKPSKISQMMTEYAALDRRIAELNSLAVTLHID